MKHRQLAGYGRGVHLFTNLNLNGSTPNARLSGQQTPVRVHPRWGEWGPENVPTTRNKKRQRVGAVVALLLALTALCLLGWYFYKALNGMS